MDKKFILLAQGIRNTLNHEQLLDFAKSCYRTHGKGAILLHFCNMQDMEKQEKGYTIQYIGASAVKDLQHKLLTQYMNEYKPASELVFIISCKEQDKMLYCISHFTLITDSK
jgi:hypothetical protein